MLDLGPLYTGIGAFFGKFLSDNILKFAAWKTLLFSLFTVTFPIIIKNLLSSLFDTFAAIANQISLDGIVSSTVNFTGLTGYFMSELMIPDCLAIILTAVVIRISLNFIPFVG